MLNKTKDKIIFLDRGGFLLILNTLQLHIDPGPGALLSLEKNQINPSQTDLVFVSHAQINRANDLNALLDKITNSAQTKKSILISTPTVINGLRTGWPWLNPSYKDKLQDIYSVRESDELNIQDKILIKATKTKHEDNFNTGFILKSPKTTIGYTSDTSYFPELKEIFKGVEILIINTNLEEKEQSTSDLNLSDVKDLLTFTKPKLAILNPTQDQKNQDPKTAARRLELQTQIQTKAAYDGMIVELI